MAGQNLTGLRPESPSAPTHEVKWGQAPPKENATLGTPPPRPETMLGLWTSWVGYVSKLASDMGAAPGVAPPGASQQMSSKSTHWRPGVRRVGGQGVDPELDPPRER